MRWRCSRCGAESGPEAVYCPECGEPSHASEVAGEAELQSTLVQPGSDQRTTLVGTSAGVAPSLLDRGPDPALMQPLPRRVRISANGWVALVGGWPELSLCVVIVSVIAAGVILTTPSFIGVVGAAIVAAGMSLFIVIALLFGAAETSRTLRGYRLLRSGWAAGGEVVRKVHQKSTVADTYAIEFSFLDARGVRHRRRMEVAEEQWRTLAERQHLTVLYRPEKPQDCAVYELLGITAVNPRGTPQLPEPFSEVESSRSGASEAAP